jgi:hypothetical protein
LAELHRDRLVERRVGARRHAWAIVRWPWKVIRPRVGAPQAYHLGRDLAERSPLGAEAPGETGQLVNGLAEQGRELRRELDPPAVADAPLDPETRAALRALGYVE